MFLCSFSLLILLIAVSSNPVQYIWFYYTEESRAIMYYCNEDIHLMQKGFHCSTFKS